ncbi:hypothetical protein HI914_00959 [Erysiphe necator]|nr:hypothetical protein HI914_00959 [Erysiphe necator]
MSQKATWNELTSSLEITRRRLNDQYLGAYMIRIISNLAIKPYRQDEKSIKISQVTMSYFFKPRA